MQVEGKWYYLWDRNGNGVIDANTVNGTTDYMTMDWLESTYFGGSTGTVITESNRSLTINGVQLLLPTDGVAGTTLALTSGQNMYLSGTSWSNATSGWDTGATPNATYDDYAAIMDAFNGTSTSTMINGLPPSWPTGSWYYLTATPTSDGHAISFPNESRLNSFIDSNNAIVVFQVL